MKHTLSLAIFVSILSQVFSQNFQWLHTVSVDFSSNPTALKTALIIDKNDNLIFSGLDSSKTYQGYGNVFIQKISQDGNIIDEIIIQGQGQSPDKFNVDNDNNLYFLIQYREEDLIWGTNSIEAYAATNHALVKLNESMDIVWVQYFEDQFSFYSSKYFIIRDGYIYLQLSEGSDNTSIVKMDLDGNILLEIFNESVSFYSTIEVDDDGNIYATGSCAKPDAMFNGTSFPPPDFYSTWLVKYNQAGEAQWVKYIIDITCNNSLIKVSGPDHIYFSGILDTEIAFDDIILNGPEWVYDFFLARLNSDGEFLWATEVPEVLTGDASVTSSFVWMNPFMEVDEEQNICLTGVTRGTIDWGNGVVSESTNNYNDILLWSYDELGNIRYAETAGGENWDNGQNIVMDNIGEIYISGIGSDTAAFGDIVYEGTGRFSFLTRFGSGTSGNIVNKQFDDIQLYPNPAKDFIYVDIAENDILSIFDMTGRLVIQQSFMEGQSKRMYVGNLKKGIYLYQISGALSMYNGKLIKK